MGCGHSKINIYPRKSRSKTNSKKAVTPEKTETEEEDGIETDCDNKENNLEDCDSRKTIKVKPFGGPLLAQAEISSSQQDFFKMLDEKIQNGPDYNSESETEKAAEQARLTALLKDWETASAGSNSTKSAPCTPKRRPRQTVVDKVRPEGVRSAEVGGREPPPLQRPLPDRGSYVSQIPQSVIHQSYGVTQVTYRQINYPTSATINHPMNYISSAHHQNPHHQQQQQQQQQPPHHQIPPQIAYPSAAMQYQALSPMYTSQTTCYQPPVATGVTTHPYQAPAPFHHPSMVMVNYHHPNPQHGGSGGGSPMKTYVTGTQQQQQPPSVNSSPSKHIPYNQPPPPTYNNPGQKMYGVGVGGGGLVPQPSSVVAAGQSMTGVAGNKSSYSNGELLQQQLYNQYQHYKEGRDQVLVQSQQQQQQSQQPPVVVGYNRMPSSRNYQSSVTIPIVVQNQQNDLNALHRKQYELT